jgi:hypothetical protein
MTFSIMSLIVTLTINDIRHKEINYNELNCDTQRNDTKPIDIQHNERNSVTHQ